MCGRDNTGAIHQHQLHTFQTTHPQHDYDHDFALLFYMESKGGIY